MEGDLVRSLECVYQSSPRVRNWYLAPVVEVVGLGCKPTPRSGSLAQHSAPLRSLQRFLPALARRANGVHLRLLSHSGRFARRGAGGETRLGLPQALPATRRDRGRSRLRLGRAGHLHGATLRRPREGLQHFARTDRMGTRVGEASRRRIAGSSLSRTITAMSPANSTSSVSVGMLEHVGRENYPELGRVIHRTIGDTGRGFLHFIGRNRPQPFSVWIRKRIFPGGLRAHRCGSRWRSSNRRITACSTSKTFACITPRPWSTGWRASSLRSTR